MHKGDLELVRSGRIPISKLITIRKGELAHNPLTGTLRPVAVELVKIAGTGKQWDCCYHDDSKGCLIYPNRPLACRALKCWDTDEVLDLVEKDTLSRFDILEEDHFLLPVIREHERICPCDDLQVLHLNGREVSDQLKRQLQKQVREEMRFRMRVVADFNLNLADELFYFGRPFFQLLQPFGARVSDSADGIHLHWNKPLEKIV